MKIIITCTPKQGKDDALHEAIVAAVRKHAKRKDWAVNTTYHKEDQ